MHKSSGLFGFFTVLDGTQYVRSMAAWVVQDMPTITLKQFAEKTVRDISSLSVAAQREPKGSGLNN